MCSRIYGPPPLVTPLESPKDGVTIVKFLCKITLKIIINFISFLTK